MEAGDMGGSKVAWFGLCLRWKEYLRYKELLYNRYCEAERLAAEKEKEAGVSFLQDF